MPNYIEGIATAIQRTLDEDGIGCSPEVACAWALLVLVKGPAVTVSDVHDAWSSVVASTEPDHPWIVPYLQLDADLIEVATSYHAAVLTTVQQLTAGAW